MANQQRNPPGERSDRDFSGDNDPKGEQRSDQKKEETPKEPDNQADRLGESQRRSGAEPDFDRWDN